ncbi:magnesium transporter CorA family protein [Geminicoccus harenae]|uniref:magnesium transporter CorA family protein n=1 Tax=Geminicoccus harenae TaxID=2498453 RepID=UPI00168AF194|nr:magnesium transporter CorA family protein [Geminicoccus harenae]
MMRLYLATGSSVEVMQGVCDEAVRSRVIWIDLLEPSPAEVRFVEDMLSIDVPTRDEIVEIEASSRLYEEADAHFMTAMLLCRAESESPELTPVTFILVGPRLVTLRYADPLPFRTAAAQIQRNPLAWNSGETVFVGLLEAIVDRLADILEAIGADLDRVSREVFTTDAKEAARQARDYRQLLARVGRDGLMIGKSRESLVSLGRLAAFVTTAFKAKDRKNLQTRIKTISRDVISLSDHASFLTNKVTFALDAILGLVSIEQNGIIKIFSVAAVVFLPPTLVASIYGMNFEVMPELGFDLGYPMALVLMVISAVAPYLYFKRKGWL